ncbi:MAG: tRNA-ribosyltransferase, partial [Pyrobaculum sp.]
MKIVLGTPINAVPRPWLYFTVPAVMVNVLEARGDLRSRLGFEGELWLDSGGYQILRRGLAVEVGDVSEIYR